MISLYKIRIIIAFYISIIDYFHFIHSQHITMNLSSQANIFFKQSSNEDYINYADEYDYNYEENLYSENIKKDTLKQAHHDDIVIFISSSDSELIYHVNTFHMYTMINVYSCCLCKMTFRFNNKLHQHIWFIHSKIKIRKLLLNSEFKFKSILVFRLTVIHVNAYYMMINIVKSDTINIVDKSGCEFHNWHYIMIFFQFKPHKSFTKSMCLNIECTMSLIDKQFLH